MDIVDGGQVEVDAQLPEISYQELRKRLRDPRLHVVDALVPESYRVEHIAGAINLPLADIERQASVLLPDRNAEIAIYCAKFT